MPKFIGLHIDRIPRIEAIFGLVWSGCVGLGFAVSCLTGGNFLLVFRQGLGTPTSVLGVFLAMLWPVGLATLGVWLYGCRAMLPLCVFKGLSYGFCAGCTVRAFGQAGFLGWFFLMFADTGMLWILCWYCLRRLRLERKYIFQDFAIVFFCAAVLGGIEHFVISPFVIRLSL